MIKDKILELASRSGGVSYKEVFDEIGFKNWGCTGKYMSILGLKGLIFKAGSKNLFRYFTNPENAKEYEAIAAQERSKSMEEAKNRKREANRIRMQNKRDSMPKAVKVAKPPKPEKQKAQPKIKALLDKKPKAQNIVIENKQQAIDNKRAHLKAVVVWPESVKVQVVPGFQGDTRYKPGPGYVGGFTQEWNERRAA